MNDNFKIKACKVFVINGNVYRLNQSDGLDIIKWSAAAIWRAAQRHDPPSVPVRSMVEARGCYVKCDQEFLNGTYILWLCILHIYAKLHHILIHHYRDRAFTVHLIPNSKVTPSVYYIYTYYYT